jgi:hypothetical protein
MRSLTICGASETGPWCHWARTCLHVDHRRVVDRGFWERTVGAAPFALVSAIEITHLSRKSIRCANPDNTAASRQLMGLEAKMTALLAKHPNEAVNKLAIGPSW